MVRGVDIALTADGLIQHLHAAADRLTADQHGVLGAAGQQGRAVIRSLTHRGIAVRALVRAAEEPAAGRWQPRAMAIQEDPVRGRSGRSPHVADVA